MPTIVTKTIGASGRDYASISAFFTWLGTQNLVTNDQSVVALIYDNLSVGASALVGMPSNSDLTRYCTIKPAPGLSYRDLNPSGVFDMPSTGIKLTFTSSASFKSVSSSAGIVWEDLIIESAGGTQAPFTLSNSAGGKSPGTYQMGVRRCVVRGTANNARALSFAAGSNGSFGFVEDCLIIDDAATGTVQAVGITEQCRFERNTIVKRGANTSTGVLYVQPRSTGLAPAYGTPIVRDNVIIGNVDLDYASNGAATVNRNLSSLNIVSGTINVTNPSAYTEYNAGTFATSALQLVENTASNYRPSAGSPLIDAASTYADTTQDINLGNRGTAPDIGAIQRTPVSPLPGATITNTTVSGQTVTISGTTTNTPTSATATLSASSGGAVTQSGVAVTLGAGTFTVTFTALSPGVYSPISLSLTNAGGTSVVNGAAGVTILEISGTPQTPGEGTGEGTGGGAVSGLYSGAVAVTRIYVGTTEITGLAVGSAVIF